MVLHKLKRKYILYLVLKSRKRKRKKWNKAFIGDMIEFSHGFSQKFVPVFMSFYKSLSPDSLPANFFFSNFSEPKKQMIQISSQCKKFSKKVIFSIGSEIWNANNQDLKI